MVTYFSGEVPRELHDEEKKAAGQKEGAVEGHPVAHVDPVDRRQGDEQHQQKEKDIHVGDAFLLGLGWCLGFLQADLGDPHPVDKAQQHAQPHDEEEGGAGDALSAGNVAGSREVAEPNQSLPGDVLHGAEAGLDGVLGDSYVVAALLLGGGVEPPVLLLDSVDAQADRGGVLGGQELRWEGRSCAG